MKKHCIHLIDTKDDIEITDDINESSLQLIDANVFIVETIQHFIVSLCHDYRFELCIYV